MRLLKVGVVAANDLVRSGIKSIISSNNHNIQIVGSFQSLAECEAFLQRQSIPILILDDALPVISSQWKLCRVYIIIIPS